MTTQKKTKMKFSKRIKNYFTDKPKGNFWFHAFVTLFLFRYVGPMMIMFLMFFNLGLVVPESDLSNSMEAVSETLVETFTEVMGVMFNAGATIGIEHPTIAKILFFMLSNLVYVIWFATLVLLLNLARYIFSWIYRRAESYATSNTQGVNNGKTNRTRHKN